MSKYEREPVDARSLQVGNIFEHPTREDVICKVEYSSLRNEEFGQVKIVSYSIVGGPLHWPVIYMPPGSEVILLHSTTLYVTMPGKEWISNLTKEYGIKE